MSAGFSALSRALFALAWTIPDKPLHHAHAVVVPFSSVSAEIRARRSPHVETAQPERVNGLPVSHETYARSRTSPAESRTHTLSMSESFRAHARSTCTERPATVR